MKRIGRATRQATRLREQRGAPKKRILYRLHAETRSAVSLEIFHTQRGRVGGAREGEGKRAREGGADEERRLVRIRSVLKRKG